jgi:trimethylamine--corrinoid protein Co-methyltransferase
MSRLAQRLAETPILLADGATGTNLFEMGLLSGDAPELWNDEHPDRIARLNRMFADAGADIILTNTFGCNARRLMLHEAQTRTRELNRKAAEIAREVADGSGRNIVVAGSVGPTGDLFAPLGVMTEEWAIEVFAEQMEGLKAGGADVAWIETMSSIEEMRAAALAAAKVGMPFTITASFDTAGRTMMGITPQAMVEFVNGLALAPLAFGANCGVGASDLVNTVLGFTEHAPNIPVIAKANAGVPTVAGDKVLYSGTPELMMDYVHLAANAGARIIGGCCGTSPKHLAGMRRALDEHQAGARPDLAEVTRLLGALASPPATERTSRRGERRARGEVSAGDASASTSQPPPATEAGTGEAGPRAGRTGRRSRESRAGTQALAAIPAQLENPWKPVEVLSEEQVERIINAGFRILAEVGIEIRSKPARDLYRSVGALVDDEMQIVRLGRDIVEAQLAHAPATFVLHARNAERNLHVGGNIVNFGPVSGAPHITDLERGRRYGDLDAFRDMLKVLGGTGAQHWQGGVLVEPVDIPVPLRQLEMYRAHIELSDLVWAARGVGGENAMDAIAMSAIERRCTIDDLAARPTLLTVTNVNSPRRVDEEILDNIMTMARHGQAVVITPFTLMGAMAPVTLAGALVQQTAEALAIVTLCQIIRPGSPCVLGAFTSNVDMKTGSPAFGTPEFVHATLAATQIARRLKLPVRTSAACASPTVDAQSTYETGFSLWAAIMGHSNLITHTTGWIEGGLSASFEKIIVDTEMLRGWAETLKRYDFSEDDLAIEAIRGVDAGGHFFGTAHTLARYETAFYRPLLSDWQNFENWNDAGAKNATLRANAIWKRLRDEFVPPPLDPGIREELDAYVARRKRELGFGA